MNLLDETSFSPRFDMDPSGEPKLINNGQFTIQFVHLLPRNHTVLDPGWDYLNSATAYMQHRKYVIFAPLKQSWLVAIQQMYVMLFEWWYI
jgi:hypothetical protein